MEEAWSWPRVVLNAQSLWQEGAEGKLPCGPVQLFLNGLEAARPCVMLEPTEKSAPASSRG